MANIQKRRWFRKRGIKYLAAICYYVLAIGAPYNNGNGTSSGQVRVFQNTRITSYNVCYTKLLR